MNNSYRSIDTDTSIHRKRATSIWGVGSAIMLAGLVVTACSSAGGEDESTPSEEDALTTSTSVQVCVGKGSDSCPGFTYCEVQGEVDQCKVKAPSGYKDNPHDYCACACDDGQLCGDSGGSKANVPHPTPGKYPSQLEGPDPKAPNDPEASKACPALPPGTGLRWLKNDISLYLGLDVQELIRCKYKFVKPTFKATNLTPDLNRALVCINGRLGATQETIQKRIGQKVADAAGLNRVFDVRTVNAHVASYVSRDYALVGDVANDAKTVGIWQHDLIPCAGQVRRLAAAANANNRLDLSDGLHQVVAKLFNEVKIGTPKEMFETVYNNHSAQCAPHGSKEVVLSCFAHSATSARMHLTDANGKLSTTDSVVLASDGTVSGKTQPRLGNVVDDCCR